VQTHIDACEHCAEVVALERAMRLSLRRVTYEEGAVNDDFRARLQQALRQAEAPVVVREPGRRRRRVAPRAREFALYWGGPLAFAAALLVWLGIESSKRQITAVAPAPMAQVSDVVPTPEVVPTPAAEEEPEAAPRVVAASVTSDEILDRLLDYHSAPPVPEVTEPRLVSQLERDVGVRVRMPTLMNAEWQGASVVPVVRGMRAATLRYKLPNEHSVTIYVYDAARVPLRAALTERMIRKQAVYVGYRRGYSIAALERRGLGYAVATDQDDRASVRLVTSLH
jgi:hypothetical protein